MVLLLSPIKSIQITHVEAPFLSSKKIVSLGTEARQSQFSHMMDGVEVVIDRRVTHIVLSIFSGFK
jgi:hypothetical protein